MSDRLIQDLLAAHEATGLKTSLYLEAATALARKSYPHFCDGWGSPPKCRICGRLM